MLELEEILEIFNFFKRFLLKEILTIEAEANCIKSIFNQIFIVHWRNLFDIIRLYLLSLLENITNITERKIKLIEEFPYYLFNFFKFALFDLQIILSYSFMNSIFDSTELAHFLDIFSEILFFR